MWQAASRYSYVGIFFGVAIVLGFLGGSWLDRRFNTQPYFGFLGLFFGIAAAFKELYRITRQYRSGQK
jgi:F0F1-type ATP synthase assembly protein I